MRKILAANTIPDNCGNSFSNFSFPTGEVFCNWTWDNFLCWPPTKAATTAQQNCPKVVGVDPSKLAYKRCSVDGSWEGRLEGNHSSPSGWTNYTTCMSAEMTELLNKIHEGSKDNAKAKYEIAERTRTLEFIGFSVSLTSLLVSLVIFSRFRSLRNNRTRIHKNLFVAMIIQNIIRLILYMDMNILLSNSQGRLDVRQGIHSTPMLCEAFYILLEYSRTTVYTWMLVEGLYLHTVVSAAVFHYNQSFYALYSVVGWGAPIAMTAAWAYVTAWHFSSIICWWGYSLSKYFWILEGPRLGVVLLNFLFLLNVIRVLIAKLRRTHTSEIKQVRKAVRAAILLVPLLGVSDVISIVGSPVHKTVWEFALWSYGTNFLKSFQGFFIAIFYCFLNGEVRAAVLKRITAYASSRCDALSSRWFSPAFGAYVTPQENTVGQDKELRHSKRSGRNRFDYFSSWSRRSNRKSPNDLPVME